MLKEQRLSSLYVLIPLEQISGIHLLFHVIQHRIISIRDDRVRTLLELLHVINHKAAKERRSIRQRGLVDDDGGALRLDALHDALDGGLAEIVRVRLHGQAVHAHHQRPLLLGVPHGGCRVVAGLLQHPVGNKVLPRAVGFHNGLDQVLRHVLVVRQQLLRILRQAVAAVAEGRVIVEVPDPRIQGDTADDVGRRQSFPVGIPGLPPPPFRYLRFYLVSAPP